MLLIFHPKYPTKNWTLRVKYRLSHLKLQDQTFIMLVYISIVAQIIENVKTFYAKIAKTTRK